MSPHSGVNNVSHWDARVQHSQHLLGKLPTAERQCFFYVEMFQPGMMAHTFDPSTQKAEAGLISEFKSSLVLIFLPMVVCAPPKFLQCFWEARWGCQIPWDWSYRYLWAAVWVLGRTQVPSKNNQHSYCWAVSLDRIPVPTHLTSCFYPFRWWSYPGHLGISLWPHTQTD